jgi:hypothetical protein
MTTHGRASVSNVEHTHCPAAGLLSLVTRLHPVFCLAVMLQVRWYDLRYTITTNMNCADTFFCPLPVSQLVPISHARIYCVF